MKRDSNVKYSNADFMGKSNYYFWCTIYFAT